MESSRRRFAGVFAATWLAFLATGAAITVLPRYVAGPIGGGEVAVGLVIGSFAFGAVLARPLAGRFADTRGRRPVLVAGALLMGAGGLMYELAGTVGGLIAARLVLGVGEGLLFTAGSAWIVDIAPVHRRAQLIGLYGLAIWGGLAVGAPIGEGLLALGGYGAVWAFTALAPVAGAVVGARVPGAHRGLAGAHAGGPLVPRGVLAPGGALFLACLGFAAFAGFVVLHLERQGDDSGPAVWTGFAIAVVASRLLLGGLPDRFGARRSVAAAACAEAVGLVIVGASSSAAPALAGALLMGAGFATIYPALALIVVEATDPRRRGAALGAFTAFFDAGLGLGGPIIGAVIGLAGYSAGFYVGAACALAAVLAAAARR